MSKTLDWAREPTTLQGAALLTGACVGAWLGLPIAITGAMASAAVPLLIPQKSELQRVAAVAAGAAVTEIGKHALFSPAAATTPQLAEVQSPGPLEHPKP